MAEFTRDNLLDFAHECRDYYVAWSDENDVMHFLAKVADVHHTFTTDMHAALQFDDENTAFMFANLVNALYPHKGCYIAELTYDFNFYRPNVVDFSKRNGNTTRSSN